MVWAGKRYCQKNPHAQVVVCEDTLGAPLFRRESFRQGVKWRTFVGKSAAAAPFLPREVTLCLEGDPSSTQVQHAFEGKGFAGSTFFSRLPWNFFFSVSYRFHRVMSVLLESHASTSTVFESRVTHQYSSSLEVEGLGLK